MATASVFGTLGATPLVGRLYDASDDTPGAEAVVVLGEAYWRRRFGGDPGVVGRSIEVNGDAATVVGVLPAREDFESAAQFQSMGTRDVWVPPQWGAAARAAQGRFLQVIARLRSGVTVEAAQREMSDIAGRLRDEFPARQAGWDVNVLRLREQIVGDVRRMLLVVFGAVCLVLLIACANVANLLVTRAIEREQELAVRTALGAGRGRLTRQLLLESAILAGAGGLLGLLLANAGLRLLVAAGPEIPRLDSVTLNPRIALFAFLATAATALFFGLLPAVHVLAGDTGAWLRERTGAVRREARRLRSALVIVQTALSLMLLIGAGLLVRSLVARFEVGVGFDTHHLMTAEVEALGPAYEDDVRRAAFFEDLVERAKALPGVESAAAITFPPLAGAGSATSFWLADRPLPPEGERPVADIRWVQRDYFATLGIPVLEGRVFDVTDDATAPLRVVVNRNAAETLWPGEDPVGRQILMPWGDTLRAEVIGVVGDVRHDGPETDLRPMFYWDHRQFQAWEQMTIVLRTAGDPEAVIPSLRAALRRLDPSLPLYNAHSMDELFGNNMARAHLATVSLGIFALLALLLAAVGLYGMIAHATRQREREIGIRMALGADTGGVVRMVLGQGMRLVLAALILGVLGSFALTRLLQGLVFEVEPTDPLTFVAMIVVLAAAALGACFIPARRAAAIQPVEAIRAE
jgi:predicted permease